MVRGWIAVALWSSMACLVGPPISEEPEVLDTPPSLAGADPDPGEIVRIDRSLTTEVVFQVDRISGLDAGDAIGYRFSVIAPEFVVPEQQKTLIVDPSRTSDEVEVYQRVTFTLQACAAELLFAEEVRVVLELTDDIPPEQVPTLGAAQHVVTVSWLVDLGEPNCVAP